MGDREKTRKACPSLRAHTIKLDSLPCVHVDASVSSWSSLTKMTVRDLGDENSRSIRPCADLLVPTRWVDVTRDLSGQTLYTRFVLAIRRLTLFR